MQRISSGKIALALCAGLASFAQAAAVGPGAGAVTASANGGLDNPGGTRTNVDLTNSVFLQPGTYSASNFSFDAGQSGSVQPFIATGTGVNGTSGDTFNVLAAGMDNSVSPSAFTPYSVPFGGTSSFTVPAGGERVYLGITNSAASNPVYIVNSGRTDHQSPGFASPVTVGQTLTGFSNPYLGRTYAYSIEIQSADAPRVINGSFEDPAIGANNFVEGVPATGWTRIAGPNTTSGSGIVANGSAYGNPAAPDGTQAALLKDEGGMSQTVGGFAAGQQYTVSFEAAGRNGLGPNPFTVSVGGNTLTFSGQSVITPGNAYALYTSDPFTATSGSEALAFTSNLTSDQDLSSYVDAVSISPVSVPEPASVAVLAVGAVGLLARRRRV